MSVNEWILILGMMAVTFGVRYPVMALVSRFSLPASLQTGLRYVPPAVLAAIIAPALFMPDGGPVNFSLSNEYLLAGVVAAIAAWRTRNILLTLVLGMATFWLLRFVG